MPGVTVSKRNNMSRRNLRYAEIALVELLRGDWERTVDDGWPALVSAARRGYIDIRAVGEEIRRAALKPRSPERSFSHRRGGRDILPTCGNVAGGAPAPLRRGLPRARISALPQGRAQSPVVFRR